MGEIPAVSIRPDLRLRKGLQVAAWRFRALREALGVKSISERIVEMSRKAEPDPTVGPLERRIQAFRTWLGIHGMAELIADPQEYFKRRREVGPVERRVKAFIKALGMRGLPELMEEMQRNLRLPRPVSPAKFYQAGLTMEPPVLRNRSTAVSRSARSGWGLGRMRNPNVSIARRDDMCIIGVIFPLVCNCVGDDQRWQRMELHRFSELNCNPVPNRRNADICPCRYPNHFQSRLFGNCNRRRIERDCKRLGSALLGLIDLIQWETPPEHLHVLVLGIGTTILHGFLGAHPGYVVLLPLQRHLEDRVREQGGPIAGKFPRYKSRKSGQAGL